MWNAPLYSRLGTVENYRHSLHFWGTIIELLTQRGVDNEVLNQLLVCKPEVTSYYVTFLTVTCSPLPLHGWSLVGFLTFPTFVLTNKHHDLAQGLKHMLT